MKRLLLLFGMVSCWISMNAQDFNETSASVCGVNVGDTLYFSFTQVGQPNGDGTVKMLYYGDLDGGYSANEAFVLFDENNNQIGYSANASSQCASAYDSVSFTIPMSTLQGWTADGTINLKVYSMSGVNPLTSLCPLGSCAIIKVKYPQVTGPNNAGVYSVDSPMVFCSGTEDIYATIGNAGTNRITSLTVNWSFDGVVQTPINYTSVLDTVGGSLSNSAQILLGSKAFVANTTYEIKVWTSNPNGVADTSNLNDTATAIVTPALSGTYTINDAVSTGGSNFNSFGDAISTISASGLCGPIVLNVLNGPYNEQVTINNVNGSSAINTITINGNGATIVDSGNVGSNYAVILLDGADYVTIDSLNIINTSTSNSVGLQFMNSADNNIIRSCVIEVSTTATSNTVIPVTFSGSATSSTTAGINGNYNLLEDNTIIGGYYGIRHYGSGTTSRIVGNQFVNNTIQDFYYYGIYNYYTEETEVIGNDIHRLNRAGVSNFYAIYNYYTTENVVITDNWIHDGFAQATGSTSTYYGIYSSACDNSTGNEALVANNLFTNVNNGGAHYVIYNSSSDGWSYYHNTMVENDPTAAGTGTTRMFYQTTTASDINFKNNLLYLDRGTSGAQYLMYLNATASGYDVDNNAYYMPAAGTMHDFGYYSGDQTDFATWKTVNSAAFDQNSFEGDPFFVDPANGNFTPTAAYFNNVGTNLQSLVSTDILGTARSISPDPGAYEFTPPPGPDMSILNIYSGGASCGTSTDIIVEVINQGTDTVTSFTLNYTVGGVAQTLIAMTGVWATGEIDSISITGVPISSTTITTVVPTITLVSPGTDTDPVNNSGTIDLRSGLSGNYTVNQAAATSATNFISFTSLANALMNYGICGNVIVDVVGTANTYTEQVWLDEIPGTSSSATVTINGNGNNLQFLSTSSGERATLTLNGTDWLIIDSLNITALGGSGDYGFGVILTNNADHNTFSNCVITVADDQTSNNFAGFAITGALTSATSYGQSGNYNTIEGNTIHGGYYGFTCMGESSDSTNGNIIRNNMIEDFYYYGTYLYYSRNLEFSGNDISRAGRTTTTTLYALRAYYGMSAKIEGNKVHDGFTGDPTSSSTSYYMYIYYMEGTSSNPTVVANNMVYNTESDGTTFGMYFGSCANTTIAHNTVVLDDPNYAGTSSSYYCRGVYFTSSTADVDYSNNLIYYDVDAPNTTNSYMIYASSFPSTMDNNVYYIGTNAPSSFGYSGGAVSTFSDWQTTTNMEVSSVLSDPYLTDLINGDFTPRSSLIDGLGADLTSLISTDINGVARGVPTDPGAIEFTGAPCTGLSGVNTTNITATSGTVSWLSNPSTVTIEWGPVGFKQASIVGTTINVPVGDTSAVISSLSSNSCYDYYITMNCTSTIPGAPSVMGPYTFCTECAGGALQGTFTVGGTPGPNNFATLDSVITALNGCGIQGPCVFNLQGGTHSGFTLGLVDGSSATNTITFNGSASVGDSIVGIGATAAVDLDGASYVNFNDLHIANSGNFVVWMHNGAHHLNFDNCDLLGDITGSSSTSAVFVATGSPTSAITSGDNASHVSLTNSNIKGNYYGVSFYGPGSTAKNPDLEISNNTFTDQYYYGVRTYYMDSVLIEGNSITGLRNTASYGMYVYYTDNAAVLANEVYGASTYAMYLYYTNYSNATTGSYSIVANNMLQSSGTAGLYVYYPVNVDIFHNSIQGGTTYGMYLSGSATATQDVDIRNNIIENAGTGTAFYVSTAPANTSIDYNLYNSGGNIGNGEATLAAWQTSDTSWNQNSVQSIPGFAATDNFHIIGAAPNDIGDNTAGITTDINGDVRPASGSTIVDIGADEYTPVAHDIAIINGEFSKKNKCLSTTDSIVLDIQNVTGVAKNFATTSLTAYWDVTGPINSNGIITVSTGTLAPLDTLRLVGTPVDLSTPGVYTLNAYIAPSAENLMAINDTLFSSVSFTVYDDWDVQPDTVIVISNTTDTVVLEAKSPFLSGGSFFISEISHWAAATTGAPTGGRPTWLVADDYLEITGVPGSDLDGITLEQWSTTAIMGTHTFPAGTIIGPNGTAIIAIGQMGASVPSPSDFYYHGNGNFTSSFSSGGNNGRILKDGSGVIIDAVGVGSTYTFPAASGVTAADWSGTSGNHGSMNGVRLTGPDLNNATNWVLSNTMPQDPNVVNPGVSVPAAAATAGFDWKLNGTVIDTMPQTVVGPYTSGGVFNYIATFNGPCGLQSDTVTVIVNLPGSCPVPTNLNGTAPACDSIVVNWDSGTDSTIVAYVASGGTMGAGNLVIGASSYAATGLTPNTNYDFYVANICGADTSMFAGPYTINSGSAGAPVASFTANAQSFFGLVYNFDASATSGNGNTYAWDFGDGSVDSSGSVVSHAYTAGGAYTITLIVTNACGSDTLTMTLADVSMTENVLSQNLKLYPNPATDVLNVELNVEGDTEVSIRILDMSGKQVLALSKDKKGKLMSESIDISNLAKGVYMIEVSAGQAKTVKRLVKE